MHRTLWRRFVLVVAVQFGATLFVLLLLQGAWRKQHRFDHGATLATLTAERLTGQVLDARNVAVQNAIDQAASQHGIAGAALVDDQGRVLCQSSQPRHSSDRVEWITAAIGTSPDTQLHVDPLKNRVFYEAPVQSSVPGSTYRVVIGLEDLTTRRAVVDGAFAALGGLLVVAICVLPLTQRRFGRWIRGLHQLHASVRRLALDRLPKPIPVGGDDEIAYLSIAFNEMAGRLSATHRKLLATNACLEERVAERTDELREANAELEIKNEKLAELTEKAMQFTDNVAHEFRTPLTVIREFASITADGLGGEVTDSQSEYLGFIINATGELAQLVDDFLDSGKLRAGTLRVDRRSCTVDDILDPVWTMLETRAASRELTLERPAAASELPRVYADVEKAGRALINLVTNAIKFSPDRGVIRVSVGPDDAGGTMRFSVSDQGRGMPPDEVATLFQRFKQGGEGTRSAAKGFGLGLNIVRDLVAINLGSIMVESTVGEGSKFSFEVPIDEIDSIIRAFLRHTTERDASAVVSALHVTADSDLVDEQSLRSYLSGACYPTDLLIRAEGEMSFVVVGQAGSPERWCRKLNTAYAQSCSDAAARLHIHCLGTWPASGAAPQILRCCAKPAAPHAAPLPRAVDT